MLTIPQYDNLIQNQYQDAEKRTKDFRIVIHFDFQFFTRYFVARAIRRIDATLPTYLIKAKGLLADLQSREAELSGSNLRAFIDHLDRFINLLVYLREKLPSIEDTSSAFPEIDNWKGILTETIETLYATMRLAKRYNLKTPRPVSDLAIESSKRSLSSLQRTSYVRRAT